MEAPLRSARAPDQPADDLSSHSHRQFVGFLGLLMPGSLYLIAAWRHEAIPSRWTLLSSVSAYYYTGAVAIFAGVLLSLAVYLFTYRGYDNKYLRYDRAAAIIAGAAAVLVSIFPTAAPQEFPKIPWWECYMGKIHNFSAAVLFLSFIFFALFQFTRSDVKKGDPLPPDKKVRNGFYVGCGLGMMVCLAWALVEGHAGAPIFWPETLALQFFAVAWLVKGRVEQTAVGRRTVSIGRFAVQMVSRARGVNRV